MFNSENFKHNPESIEKSAQFQLSKYKFSPLFLQSKMSFPEDYRESNNKLDNYYINFDFLENSLVSNKIAVLNPLNDFSLFNNLGTAGRNNLNLKNQIKENSEFSNLNNLNNQNNINGFKNSINFNFNQSIKFCEKNKNKLGKTQEDCNTFNTIKYIDEIISEKDEGRKYEKISDLARYETCKGNKDNLLKKKKKIKNCFSNLKSVSENLNSQIFQNENDLNLNLNKKENNFKCGNNPTEKNLEQKDLDNSSKLNLRESENFVNKKKKLRISSSLFGGTLQNNYKDLEQENKDDGVSDENSNQSRKNLIKKTNFSKTKSQINKENNFNSHLRKKKKKLIKKIKQKENNLNEESEEEENQLFNKAVGDLELKEEFYNSNKKPEADVTFSISSDSEYHHRKKISRTKNKKNKISKKNPKTKNKFNSQTHNYNKINLKDDVYQKLNSPDKKMYIEESNLEFSFRKKNQTESNNFKDSDLNVKYSQIVNFSKDVNSFDEKNFNLFKFIFGQRKLKKLKKNKKYKNLINIIEKNPFDNNNNSDQDNYFQSNKTNDLEKTNFTFNQEGIEGLLFKNLKKNQHDKKPENTKDCKNLFYFFNYI